MELVLQTVYDKTINQNNMALTTAQLADRATEESIVTQPAAFVFGKFSNIHIGHIELFRQALEGHDRLYIGVSDAAKNGETSTRIAAINRIIYHNGWRGRVCVFTEKNMISAYDSIYERCDVVLGEDRAGIGERLAQLNGTSYIKVKRLTSSTEVRRRLAAGEDISDLVPRYLVNN